MLLKQKVINRVLSLPIAWIVPNPNQPRQTFDPEKLDELAISIAQYGLLQPITVQFAGKNRYELIAGERRLLACRRLHMQEIPALIMDLPQSDSAALALIENIQRCSLNYFEEARAIDNLIHLLGETQQMVAKRLGKTQSTIANKLRLLKFPPNMQEKLLSYPLTERHARALLPLASDDRLSAAIDMVIEKSWNVSQTEQYVEQLLHPQTEEKPKRLFIVKDLRIFMNTIKKATDTMKQSGINAKTEIKEDEENVVYTIRIPKKSAYKSSATMPVKHVCKSIESIPDVI